MLHPEQVELLRRLSLIVAEMSSKVLFGVDRGSVVSMALILDAMLQSGAEDAVFTSVRDRFVGLPTPTIELKTLYDSLLSVCDLAILYNEDQAQLVVESLLFLSPVNTNWN